MFSEVKNLIFVDPELASRELHSIEGKSFFVRGDFLQNEIGETICKFDHCRAGNKEHNAICLIRDMHNILNPGGIKTRPQVEKLITIKSVF